MSASLSYMARLTVRSIWYACTRQTTTPTPRGAAKTSPSADGGVAVAEPGSVVMPRMSDPYRRARPLAGDQELELSQGRSSGGAGSIEAAPRRSRAIARAASPLLLYRIAWSRVPHIVGCSRLSHLGCRVSRRTTYCCLFPSELIRASLS